MRHQSNRREFLKSLGATAVAGRLAGLTSSHCAAAEVPQPRALPRVRIGSLEVSRLIIGGNPFSGNSHFSSQVSREMREYYTNERIKQVLETAADEGVNTCLARADDHIMGVWNEYRREGGRVRYWIAQTAPERKPPERNIDETIAHGASAIYIQGVFVDRYFASGKLEDLRPLLERIRAAGLPAGMGSHRPDVLPVAERLGLPVDFYMQCFYNLTQRKGIYLAEDRARAVETIQSLSKPVIAYKILAAGRNEPHEAFSFALARIRPSDAVCVGVFPKHRPREIAEDAALTRRYISARRG